MLEKIISTGQSGVERGALASSFMLGLKSGGYIPKGYLTIEGSKPDLAVFGLEESESEKYKPSIEKCISSSDGILIINSPNISNMQKNINSLVNESGKPVLRITFSDIDRSEFERFLMKNKINTLYVTGKTEKDTDIIYKNTLNRLTKLVTDSMKTVNLVSNRY